MYLFSFEKLNAWQESIKMFYKSTENFPLKMELLNQLIIAKEIEFIDPQEYLELRKMIEVIANLTNGLTKSQLK